MFHQSASDLSPAPDVRLGDSPSDRRAHRRIPFGEIRGARARIPHRPAVSLIDVSSGGALIELPFQVPPESRFPVELHTSVEQVTVPFQLLRCYVAQLNGGLTYHAAGAFDQLLDLQALASRASCAMQNLIGTLDRLHRSGQQAASPSRSAAEFNEFLAAVIVNLRRGESLDLVTLKVKARLTQTYPSLTISPALSPYRDTLTSAQCFGLTFNSKRVLSASDRRFLKANGQLISMLEDCRREMREMREMREDTTRQSPQVIYSPAEWMDTRSSLSA